MRGKTRKISKPAKLRRPQGLLPGDVHGEITSNNLSGTGQNGDVGAALPPASTAADQDPLADLYPVGIGKTFYRTKAQGEADLMREINESLTADISSDPELRKKLRGQLIQQAGGNLTPTMWATLDSIVEQRLFKFKIIAALERHGSLRVNYKTRSVTAQSIIRDLLLPLINSERQSIKLFEDEIARRVGNGGGNGGGRYREEGTPEENMAALNELNLILGLPEQTPEQVIDDFNRLRNKQQEEE